MAIRKKDKHALKLSPLQVQEARKRFFNNVESSKSLAYEFKVAESTMKDAIHGKRGYANIPDDVPAEYKDQEYRANLKSMFTNNASKKRRNRRQNLKLTAEFVNQGVSMPVTPLHLMKLTKFDTKSAEKAAEKHWKKGW